MSNYVSPIGQPFLQFVVKAYIIDDPVSNMNDIYCGGIPIATSPTYYWLLIFLNAIPSSELNAIPLTALATCSFLPSLNSNIDSFPLPDFGLLTAFFSFFGV